MSYTASKLHAPSSTQELRALAANCTSLAEVRLLLGARGMNANQVLLSHVMSDTVHVAPGDATVGSLIALFTQHHIGCVPIVDAENRPIGIVTKLDLVECREQDRKTARDVMMPHARSLRATDTLARAASLMSEEGFHHLLVVDDGGMLRGIISTLDVTRWVANVTNPS